MRAVTRVRGHEACHMPDCETVDYLSHGLCNRHYKRWQKWGDPFCDGLTPLPDRFWPKVDVSLFGCWTWMGALDGHGYGAVKDGPRVAKAHRVAYELLVGPIPDGLTLDHLCRNVRCVRPGHLEPVTAAENIRRAGRVGYAGNPNRCQRGHDWNITPPIVVHRSNGKVSRACRVCASNQFAEDRTGEALACGWLQRIEGVA